jgi:pyruvate,water dikinase
VGSRRQEWQEAREITPPFALDQSGDHLRDVARPDEQALSGFAASPGSYTGRARVVLTPEQGADLEPGEVLVAPATSPGWAPLLLTAGALITEIGGTLSHGAIIAREYGLPAVLNVTDATRRIHTGQLIHVDGSQGTIQLLEGAS